MVAVDTALLHKPESSRIPAFADEHRKVVLSLLDKGSDVVGLIFKRVGIARPEGRKIAVPSLLSTEITLIESKRRRIQSRRSDGLLRCKFSLERIDGRRGFCGGDHLCRKGLGEFVRFKDERLPRAAAVVVLDDKACLVQRAGSKRLPFGQDIDTLPLPGSTGDRFPVF